MKIVGITGPSGSGKGYLSREFASLGYVHADADKIYHELLSRSESLRSELVHAFGADIEKGGAIDRKVLGLKVFGRRNARKLQRLNKIAHKYVAREYVKLIVSLKSENAKGLIIDAPLLIEARLHKLCDTNIAVLCGREERIARIMARDKIDRAAAELRINSQKDISFYTAHCDRVFLNDGSSDVAAFAAKIDKILHGEADCESI